MSTKSMLNGVKLFSLVSGLLGYSLISSNLAYATPDETELLKPTVVQEIPFKNTYALNSCSSTEGSSTVAQDIVTSTNSEGQTIIKKTTLSGEDFILAPHDPVLGEGWIDPRGIIWYDIILDKNGIPNKMTYEEANEFCAKYDARIPEFDDLRMVINWFSGKFAAKERRYVPQIFSNHLDKPFWINHYTTSESLYTQVFVLESSWMVRCKLSKKIPVRCVRQIPQSRED